MASLARRRMGASSGGFSGLDLVRGCLESPVGLTGGIIFLVNLWFRASLNTGRFPVGIGVDSFTGWIPAVVRNGIAIGGIVVEHRNHLDTAWLPVDTGHGCFAGHISLIFRIGLLIGGMPADIRIGLNLAGISVDGMASLDTGGIPVTPGGLGTGGGIPVTSGGFSGAGWDPTLGGNCFRTERGPVAQDGCS